MPSPDSLRRVRTRVLSAERRGYERVVAWPPRGTPVRVTLRDDTVFEGIVLGTFYTCYDPSDYVMDVLPLGGDVRLILPDWAMVNIGASTEGWSIAGKKIRLLEVLELNGSEFDYDEVARA